MRFATNANVNCDFGDNRWRLLFVLAIAICGLIVVVDAHDDGSDETAEVEESRAKLSSLVERMDANADGEVTLEELREWIRRSQRKYIDDDVERQWRTYADEEVDVDTNSDSLSWDKYRKKSFGFLDGDSGGGGEEDRKVYLDMLSRDERRWKAADTNGDAQLDRREFGDFLHPEEAPHMREVVVDETLADIDADGDGKVSIDEYINDMYSPTAASDEFASVPDWVTRERQTFREVRDKDGDGLLDREELRAWIVPADFDHADAEAKHLLSEADANRDGKLTRDEIISAFDAFVGSQATDFGEALMTNRVDEHDEL